MDSTGYFAAAPPLGAGLPHFTRSPYAGPLAPAGPTAGLTDGAASDSVWTRHSSALVVLVLVALALLVGYFVWRARSQAQRTQGPFAKDIAALKDPKLRADMLECQYLMQLSQQPNVTELLRGVLQSHLQSGRPLGPSAAALPPAPSAAMLQPPPAAGTLPPVPPSALMGAPAPGDADGPTPDLPGDLFESSAVPDPNDRVIVTPTGQRATVQL